MRGYGDSKSPLLFVAVSGCLNLIGDIILVKYLDMGILGTALATIGSQGISMLLAMAYLNRRNFIFQFRLKNFKISKSKTLDLAYVGIPISLQECMVRLFSNEPAIISAGIPFFKTCSFDYLYVLFVFTLNGCLNGRSKTIFTMVSCCFGALALRMPFIYIVCRYAPDQLGIIGMVAPAVSGIMAVYTLIYVLGLMKRTSCHCPR